MKLIVYIPIIESVLNGTRHSKGALNQRFLYTSTRFKFRLQ